MVLHVGTNQNFLQNQHPCMSYMVEQTRVLWGNQQPCMVLHGGTNQSTLRKPATLHGLAWWNKSEHSEKTSNLTWSYMVEQTRALWENSKLAGFTWWNIPEHSEETSSTLRKPAPWHGLTWCNKPVHSEGTSSLAWSYMLEQTRAPWGN